MTIWDDIRSERLALADDLASMSPQQWAQQSLCGEWTVKELAAHLVVPFHVTMPKFALVMLKARGSFERANVLMTAAQANRSTADLVQDYRDHAGSHFTPPGMGPEAPMAEVLIHGQDARIPVGITNTRDPELWRGTLDFLLSPKARRGFVGRATPPVTWVATDLDWRHAAEGGSAPEVSGPAYAIALTLAGRRAGADLLTGDGAPIVREWLG